MIAHMLRSWVKSLLPPPRPAATNAAQGPQPAVPGASPLRYPPRDQGLPLLSANELLGANQDLVDRLRLHAAVPPTVFQERFVDPLTRLAEHINVMPATASGLFSGEMGLFRAALECSFFAFQSSDGRIFTGTAGVEKRHALEGRWRYLCFLAGLLYPIGRTLDRVVATASDGQPWPRHHTGLTEWGRAIGIDRVFFSWPVTGGDEDSPGPSNTGLVLLPKVISAQNQQHLQDGAGELVTALYQLVVGAPTTARIAKDLLEGAWGRILNREAARRPQAFGRVVAGTHVGPYLVGAIRALLESGEWKMNDSPLKADADGLYLAWPAAGEDMIRFGHQRGYPGWPKDVSTLAALLLACRVVDERTSDLGFVEIFDADGEIHQAFKISNPLAVLEEFDPSDYPSPKRLDTVLKNDPLRKAEEAVPPAGVDAAASLLGTAPPDGPLTQADVVADPQAAAAEEPASPAAVAQPKPAPPASQPAAAAPSAPGAQPAGLRIAEPQPVSFADLVPEDVRKEIGSSMNAELLGKVIQLWRKRDTHLCRRTENGAAIAFSAIVQIVRDPAKWADAMAEAGLIYSPPGTPGLRMIKVAIPEGGKKVDSIVLSERACRKLGL